MNTVVSGFMEYTNSLIDVAKKQGGIDKSDLETLIILLAPFTPHIAEEMWHGLGHEETVFSAKWPEYDDSKLVVNTVSVAVQVNGKVRENLTVEKTKIRTAL